MSIRVAIVEDQREVREGLSFLISESSGFVCVAQCASAEEALEVIPSKAPDVILMDVQLPGMSGVDCIQELKAELPRSQIMMLTIFEDPERIFGSLKAGATGYLVKKTPPDKLLQAIKDLHQGGSPMSGQIARQVIDSFRQSPVTVSDRVSNLTEREGQILDQLVRGYSYKEIAALLGISVETVRTHIRNIYEKLHVKSRHEISFKLLSQSRGRPSAAK
jgi:DNA-binding NarL/FixJ family response regulator